VKLSPERPHLFQREEVTVTRRVATRKLYKDNIRIHFGTDSTTESKADSSFYRQQTAQTDHIRITISVMTLSKQIFCLRKAKT
jgi:hypothetical protein